MLLMPMSLLVCSLQSKQFKIAIETHLLCEPSKSLNGTSFFLEKERKKKEKKRKERKRRKKEKATNKMFSFKKWMDFALSVLKNSAHRLDLGLRRCCCTIRPKPRKQPTNSAIWLLLGVCSSILRSVRQICTMRSSRSKITRGRKHSKMCDLFGLKSLSFCRTDAKLAFREM